MNLKALSLVLSLTVATVGAFAQSREGAQPATHWMPWEVNEFLHPSPKPFRKLGTQPDPNRPGGKPAPAPQRTIQEGQREIFEDEPGEGRDEDTNILKERWKNRLSPEAYARSSELWGDSPINRVPGDGINSWRSIGNFVENPTSSNAYAGRIESIAFAADPTQGSAVVPYLGAVGGGIWKKVAVTGFYVPVNDTLPGSACVGALAIDPNDANRMIVGTGTENRFAGSGVYKTTDQGATWTRMTMPGGTQPNYCTRAIVDINDATSNTILISTDQGIYRTTNFGTTWTRVLTGVIDDLVKDKTAQNWWYATVQGQGIYLSADFGVTWSRRLDTTTLAIPRIRISYSDADSTHVYALAFTAANTLSAIWHSKDYGQTWLAADKITFASDPISAAQAFHTNFLFCDPSNADILYFGVANVAKISNARTAVGNTATTSFDGGHPDYNDFVTDPTNTNIWILNDGGAFFYWKQFSLLFDSPNRFGLSCMQTVTDDQAMAESRSSFSRLIAGLQDNYTIKIDVGATQPYKNLGGADGGRVGINTDDSNWLYSSWGAFNGAVPFRQYFTKNAATFTDITNNSLNQWAQAMVPDPYPGYGKLVYSGNSNFVLRTDTSVASPTWSTFASEQTQTIPRSIRTTEVSYDGNEAAWITFNETSDVAFVTAGVNQTRFFTCPIPWATTNTRPLVDSDRWRAYYAYASSANTSGGAPQVFRTTDYGASWTNITGNMATILGVGRVFHVIAHPYSSSVLFAATEFGILRSDNNGTTWYRDTIGMPVSTYTNGLRFSIAADGYAWLRVSTFGRGFYEKRIYATDDRPVRIQAKLLDDPRSFQQVQVEFQPYYAGRSNTTFVTTTSGGNIDRTLLVEPGKYRIRIKGSHHLAKAWENVDCMGTGTVTLPLQNLVNGDIDNDNAVTVFDYGILSDYFDKSNGDSDWFVTGGNGFAPYQADLDGDDVISVFDYGILSDSFDTTGAD